MRRDTQNKNNDDDDNDNDVKRSWDSMEGGGDEQEAVEEEDDDEEEEDQDEGDKEGIDDEAAKKYKPYRNRQLFSPITKMEARIHLLNSSLGLGIVVLPSAMCRFGLIYASFGLILISVISTHCLHILIKGMYRTYCRRHVPHLSYSECIAYAIEESYGVPHKFTPVIVSFLACLLFLCKLSIAATYVKYMGQAVTESLSDIWKLYEVSDAVIKSLLTIALLLVNSLPTIKDLVYCSIIGILAAFGAIGLIIYDISPHLSSGHVDPYLRMSEYPHFVGVVLYTTYTLGAVLLLEGNMKRPKILIGAKGILNQISLILMVIYLVFGIQGAMILRSTRTKRMIVDHLWFPTKFTHDAKFFLILVCFFSHPLVCYEMFEIVWNSRVKKYIQESLRMRQNVINYIVRVVIVVITVGLAYPRPHDIPLLVSLIGTLLISIVGIILPSFLHMLTSNKPTRWIILKDILLLSFGFSAFIGGIYMIVINSLTK